MRLNMNGGMHRSGMIAGRRHPFSSRAKVQHSWLLSSAFVQQLPLQKFPSYLFDCGSLQAIKPSLSFRRKRSESNGRPFALSLVPAMRCQALSLPVIARRPCFRPNDCATSSAQWTLVRRHYATDASRVRENIFCEQALVIAFSRALTFQAL